MVKALQHNPQSETSVGSQWIGYGLTGFTCGLAIALMVSWSLLAKPRAVQVGSIDREIPTFLQLCDATADELARIDIGRMNLLCAQGLPGSAGLSPESTLLTLDQWARRVKSETAKYRREFLSNPAEFNHSENQYRMMTLVTVLQQDLGIHYDPDQVSNPDFRDSRDQFIHGLLGQGRAGTCVTMPVLYAAVGRRLGYPLKLVLAKQHIFLRWDNPIEKFNIEATTRGFTTFSDEEYTRWPQPMTTEETQGGYYLKSLGPTEELAVFLTARGHCLEDNGRFAESQVVYALAHQLMPHSPHALDFLAAAVTREQTGSSLNPFGPLPTPSQARRDTAAQTAQPRQSQAASSADTQSAWMPIHLRHPSP